MPTYESERRMYDKGFWTGFVIGAFAFGFILAIIEALLR